MKYKKTKKKNKSFKVENKAENEILLLSYLNLFNPKNDSPGLRYDVIDLDISDSTDLKTIKSAMNSVKKKGGFFFYPIINNKFKKKKGYFV